MLLGGGACYYLANSLDRSNFFELLSVWLVLLLVYVYVLTSAPRRSEGFVFRWLAVSILFQLILVTTTPVLSDDFYRYLWDGQLLNHSMNPYTSLPQEVYPYLESVLPNAGELYQGLNSPLYFTIYPPVAQALFAFSCWLFPAHIAAAVLVLQLSFLFAQLGVLILLVRTLRLFNQPLSSALIYAMNPLIIVELVGNLHLEVVMLFFLALSFYMLLQKKQEAGAFFFGCAVATKLIPLILLPVLVVKLGWKKALRFTAIVFITVVVCFLPFLGGEMLTKLGSSIDLYFRSFEFNASLYYLFREIGYQVKGYNLIQFIGPLLALVSSVVIIILSRHSRNQQWKGVWITSLWVFALYFFMSTTVHPWYLATPLFFSVFATNYRFVQVWAIAVVLSYAAYSTEPYHENLWLVVVEYLLVVLMLLYDIYQRRRKAVFTKA